MSCSPPVNPGTRTAPELLETIRGEEFKQLCAIQWKLEEKDRAIMFDDSELSDLLVARGASFDIDQDDPLDLEPRYFLPGPVDKMEKGLRTKGGMPWIPLEPVEIPKANDNSYWPHHMVADGAYHDVRARANFCESAARDTSSWVDHQFQYKSSRRCDNEWVDASGRPCFHQFWSGVYYMWPSSESIFRYNPDIPHALGTAWDISRPRHGSLLRSELIVANALLKTQIRHTHMFLHHKVFPVLLVSFHDRYSARILQAHLENGRMVVRPSRLLNMHTAKLSADAKLAIRWLNCRPVGETRYPILKLPSQQDEGQVEVETSQEQNALRPHIEVP